MPRKKSNNSKFHINFLTTQQKMAWAAYQQHHVLFLLGPAGSGKTFLSMAFAIHDILQKEKEKIILTRPIVEAGERLGYLPGDLEEKVNPYMMPLFDAIDKLIPQAGPQKEQIRNACEIAPVAYLRGRTFTDSVAIFDEAQNATLSQLRLFLSRLGENSKMIITGDPSQTDLGDETGLMNVVHRLEAVSGISILRFKEDSIVRHPLLAAILKKLEE